TPDECETLPDCNTNAVPDVCEPSGVEMHKFTASDAFAGDRFGSSVSVSGDWAIVGAPRADAARNPPGSAYVYRYDGSAWVEEAKLANPNVEPGNLGTSVSVNGDLALIGVYMSPGTPPYGPPGAAYVYRYNGSSWVEEAMLLASDPIYLDWFGFSVSMSNGVVAIGAYGDDDAGNDSGSVYLYRNDGTTWVEEAKLTASDAAADDYFGYSVAVNGDLAVIGAYGEEDAGALFGCAYVYRYDAGIWVEQAKLTPSDAASGDAFGWSVAISGTLALIGAPNDDDGGHQSGSAYAFAVGIGDCDTNGLLDECDIAAGSSLDCNVNGILDQCEPGHGDDDCDGDVDVDDFVAWPACMTGPDNGPYAPGCEVFDFDADEDVDVRDFAGFQTMLQPLPPGDFDGDGDVDLDDFADWPACVTGPDQGPYAPGCDPYDLDADLDVDMADFSRFQAAYTD
ncbi:MAG: FG-GAP repeat protein, partial [Planctomycetes bacterium]|nr:FG-GAP repeat protein [Planctomycetota bacterium]